MRRLLAVALLAGLGAVPHAFAYDRECGGILDTECRGFVCSLDCFYRDCLVWVDVQHNPQSAQCVPAIVAAR